MYLVEGINNDVILSSLVSAGHMFLQQPTHPTFPVLSRLIMTMSQCYTEEETPTLPNPARKLIPLFAQVRNLSHFDKLLCIARAPIHYAIASRKAKKKMLIS
jgi:hypothetical protein